jgi:glyoxylase-like metal-dependent hydrolase (beta-lactamase superfamily II)
MKVIPFFDKPTFTFTYVVIDPNTNCCAVIDSVRDYDIFSGRTNTDSADQIISYIKDNDLKLEWILETHIHADHLTASSYIKSKIGGKTAIGKNILKVLDYWVPVFNTTSDTPLDASQFDKLLQEGDKIKIGSLTVDIIETPGHTPSCISYLIGDSIFVGDSIFMPHLGTARADFPGGNAEILYNSIQKILSLPKATKIYVCHDYPEENQKESCMSTVKEQAENNIMINKNISKIDYIDKRSARDKTLSVPKLILPSIQINLRAGKLTPPEDNGISYIKIPLNKI